MLGPSSSKFLFQSLTSLKYMACQCLLRKTPYDSGIPGERYQAPQAAIYDTEHFSKLLNVTQQVNSTDGHGKHIQLPSLRSALPSLCWDPFMDVALFGSSSMQWWRFQALQSLRLGSSCQGLWFGTSYSTSLSLCFPFYQVGITACWEDRTGALGQGS